MEGSRRVSEKKKLSGWGEQESKWREEGECTWIEGSRVVSGWKQELGWREQESEWRGEGDWVEGTR